MKFYLILAFIALSLGLSAQVKSDENVWKTLSKISYKKEYDELMGFKIDKPVFNDQIKALEGKEITLKGYIIPTDGYKSHTEFIFRHSRTVCASFVEQPDRKQSWK